MLPIVGWTLLGLGIFVWLFGNRMWLLGAGAGALLGFGLLTLIPSLSDGWLGFIIVIGLAILFGVLGMLGKAFTKLIAMVIGFIAGGALVIAFMGMFGIEVSFLTWIIALLGGLIGAGLFSRFVNWGLIIFASLLGSMLVVRGLGDLFLSSLNGTLGSVVVVVLTIVGIFYHARKMK
jgi:hypothetical protein